MPLALIVNDTDVMVDTARKGLGIERIVIPLVAEDFKRGSLTLALEANWYAYPSLFVYFMQNSQKARRVRALINFLVEKGTALFSTIPCRQ